MDNQTARTLLEDERERLQGIIDGQPDDPAPAPGDVADQGADAASHTFDREMNESVEEQAEVGLTEIDEALQRIEDGTYGVCEIGGEQIPDARLEAMPAARYCVEHQQEVERQAAAGGYEGADPTI